MNGLEKKFREKNSYPIDITEYDDNAKYLIGWPGYRTSNNKSGLGYMETQNELAHMQGVMFRQMITGKFVTHNPFFLFCMFVFGMYVGVIPLVMLLVEFFVAGNRAIVFLIFPVLPHITVGVALVVNVIISVLNPNAKSITGN
jgi:hypothetical protein